MFRVVAYAKLLKQYCRVGLISLEVGHVYFKILLVRAHRYPFPETSLSATGLSPR